MTPPTAETAETAAPAVDVLDLGDVVELQQATPASQPYDPEKDRETARGRIAALLMILLAVLSLCFVVVSVALVRPFDRETVGLLISGVFGPVIGIVGTVVGFYFGQSAARRG